MRRERENAQKVKEIEQLLKGLDGFTAEERNEIIRSIVKECTWDGETLSLLL